MRGRTRGRAANGRAVKRAVKTLSRSRAVFCPLRTNSSRVPGKAAGGTESCVLTSAQIVCSLAFALLTGRK